ncbi:lipoprotein-releasing system transmembrane subunit LolC [Microbulbifer flavimaris]|uniref:Lipoprotein-releasing system transmembrane subunit LolC n=1 Tax=Microbulbifer flavimaris TaxID=1781068 RepID=A0ABX4I3G2_9GAMM|nr:MULTISPECIES: lipoprotein-releasing ABC transporter permease subunit [Microbulbifer]KUJ84860.1 cell division protein FtsX [Microbulbifer sp. ZGT114]PCO06957.1 lipoprotein-releasing system transmembrane subunit LolC [Microbulbifer flavimaris]
MLKPVPLYIGLRYVAARRRQQFISFINGFSLLGMALGVMALIVVTSVMNGFDRELKTRILSVVPHGFVERQGGLEDWQGIAESLQQKPHVEAASPFVNGFALLGAGGTSHGVEFQGVDPSALRDVSTVGEHMVSGSLDNLQPRSYNIVLGRILARQLNAIVGDSVVLTLPEVVVTPAGIFPRTKRFTVAGIFSVGAQVDQGVALVNIEDAARLLRMPGKVQGLQLRFDDMNNALGRVPAYAADLGEEFSGEDWSQSQGSLFQAVKMEKTVVTLMLMIIVAVAAFNIVSALVLMVADKRSDIAVLRTLGLTSRQIMSVFVVQGSAIGIIGAVAGAVLGTLIAFNLTDMVTWVENLLGAKIFDPRVFFVSFLPSEFRTADAVTVLTAAILMSLLATLFPAWRASQIQPAEALRYE